MMMDVIYRLDHPGPPQFTVLSVSPFQSQSSLVPHPVCQSSRVPRSLAFMPDALSACVSLGCVAVVAAALPKDHLLRPLQRAGWGLPSQTCSRFSYGCASERIAYLSCHHPPLPEPSPSGLVSVSGFPSQVSMQRDKEGRRGESWTSKTPETASRLTVT